MNTKFVGHRGSLGVSVENTKNAFLEGVRRKVYALECDIHVTKDGEFVIIHDDTLERLNKDHTKKIWEYTLDELKNIELYQEFNGQSFSANICSLEEYLQICSENNINSIIEIKYSPNLCGEDISKLPDLYKLIEKYNWLDRTTFISFIEPLILKIRGLDKKINLQLLVCGKINEKIDLMNQYNIDIDTSYDESVNRENIDLIHKNNHKINIYTIDDPEHANKLIELNVDYITSNLLS